MLTPHCPRGFKQVEIQLMFSKSWHPWIRQLAFYIWRNHALYDYNHAVLQCSSYMHLWCCLLLLRPHCPRGFEQVEIQLMLSKSWHPWIHQLAFYIWRNHALYGYNHAVLQCSSCMHLWCCLLLLRPHCPRGFEQLETQVMFTKKLVSQDLSASIIWRKHALYNHAVLHNASLMLFIVVDTAQCALCTVNTPVVKNAL